MATAAVVTRMSVEEYLRTPFRPDVDFVDGVIEERNSGEWDHGRLQGFLYALILGREQEWGVSVSIDVRVQVSTSRLRIPDVCVIDARWEAEQITRKAPLLCIEVKSPEDRLPRLFERVKDFHRMGVGVGVGVRSGDAAGLGVDGCRRAGVGRRGSDGTGDVDRT